MCISDEARRLATAHFEAQFAIVGLRADSQPLRDAALKALDSREGEDIRAVVEAVRGGPWELGVLAALSEVAMVLAPAALGDAA